MPTIAAQASSVRFGCLWNVFRCGPIGRPLNLLIAPNRPDGTVAG